MIKIIQLLKDSFSTYKLNFKNIFNMTWPIVLLTIVAQYYSININQMMDTKQFDIPYLVMAAIIYFICMLVVGLFLAPALSRSVQKNEDNGVFDVKEGYSFQKKNIWKFVMVNIWGGLYMLKRCAVYIVISLALVGVLIRIEIINKSTDTLPVVLIILSLIGLILFTAIVLNITRFILYKNIFFSKDNISARDAVKESMSLGVSKMNDIWKIILAMIILAIAMEIVLKIFSLFIFNVMVGLVIGSLIMIVFSMPYMLIIVSKGYVRVRGGDVALPVVENVEVVNQ